jgi:hypothetical protein
MYDRLFAGARNPLPRGEGGRKSAGRGVTTHSLWQRGSAHSWKGRAGRTRSCDIGGAADFFSHPIEPLFYVVIGETKLEIAAGFDRRPAVRIGKRLARMMAPVEFNRPAEIVAAEVDNIAGDWRLPPKL